MESRLEKLYEMGYQIESKEPTIALNLEELLLKKQMTTMALVRKTGISKQTMSSIINGKLKPGIDLALKIAEVLDVRVEEIFSLNASAWETMITNDGRSVFWDLAELKIIEGPDVKNYEEEHGIEHWDTTSECLISAEQYHLLLEQALEQRLDEEIEKAREAKVRRREERVYQKMAREAIEKDMQERYPLRFQRVVKSIKEPS